MPATCRAGRQHNGCARPTHDDGSGTGGRAAGGRGMGGRGVGGRGTGASVTLSRSPRGAPHPLMAMK